MPSSRYRTDIYDTGRALYLTEWLVQLSNFVLGMLGGIVEI